MPATPATGSQNDIQMWKHVSTSWTSFCSERRMCRQVLPWPEERGPSARALAPSAQPLSLCAAAVSRKKAKVTASLNTLNQTTYIKSDCWTLTIFIEEFFKKIVKPKQKGPVYPELYLIGFCDNNNYFSNFPMFLKCHNGHYRTDFTGWIVVLMTSKVILMLKSSIYKNLCFWGPKMPQ